MSSTAPHIRIGTRGSDLALWQAHHVRDLLQARGATVEIVVLKTRGDQIQNVSFDKMEGKGFFTKEIEQALLDGDVDLAVHSHKDLETTPPAGLVVAAVPPRGPVEDVVLVRPESVDLTTPFHVQRGGVVGTSSMRRKNQLELGQPDLRIEALRGNVPTRIQKLRDGQYDAIMLAHAGVHRLELDLTDLHVHVLDPLNFVPAPAQGALALQMREGDPLLPFVEALTDPDTVHAIGLERSILRELEGGCQLPFGAYVPGGTRNVYTYLGEARGPLRQAWFDVSASDATEGPFLQDLTSPAPWPSAFITQDLAPDAPLRALFATRGADLQGASCIEVRPSGEAVPGTPAEGDWLFLGSPKCAALFAATHDLYRFRIATMGEGTRQALPSGTHIAWTGNGNPEEVFKALAKQVGDATVWIPHANRTMRRWEGHLSQAKPWHFYDVEAREVALPDHEVALVLSPSNAEGYKASGRHRTRDRHRRHHGRTRHAHRADAWPAQQPRLKLGDGAPHSTDSAPLDVATDGGLLAFRGDGFAFEQEIHHATQVFACHGDVVARASAVKLTPVHANAVRVKHAEVRGARRVVGAGDILGGVVEVGEREGVGFCQRFHEGHVVLRVVHHVVAGDGHHVDPLVAAF